MRSEMVSNVNISNIINGSSATVISEAPLQVHEYYTEPAGAVIGRLTFEATLAMVGVLGNMLVCLVIARMKTKSAINRYLFNLAIADIGVLIVVFPIAVLQEQIRSYFPLGRRVCLYVYPVIDTFYGASIWLVASVAVERYINIVKRVKAYRNRSLKTTTFAIVAIWLISFSVISLPLFFVIEFKEETSACFIDWFKTPSLFLWRQVYTISLTMFTYVVPLSIISWTYVQIGGRIAQSTGFNKEIERKRSSTIYGNVTRRKLKNGSNRLKENTKAKRILTPLVVTFAVSMLPINVFRLVALYWPRVFLFKYFWILHNVLVIFTTANSAVNPLIYSVVSREFRRGFLVLLFQGKQKFRGLKSLYSTAFQESDNGYDVTFCPKDWPKPEFLRETNV